MRSILCATLICFMSMLSISYTIPVLAQFGPNEIAIIPAARKTPSETLDDVKSVASGGNVRDVYTEISQKPARTLGDEFASGIMTRQTILNYITYLVRFLGQLGLLIGALMIVYAGYLYASSVFSGSDANQGKTAIKYAVIGVLVISFAYGIMRVLTNMFLT